MVFGAVVLLLFPDRPGGKIGWQGAEVSSVGAGLPLIVVGVVAVAIASVGAVQGDDGDGGGATGTSISTGTTSTAATGACPDQLLAGLPEQRIATVEVGAQDQVVVRPGESKTEPFGLRLTDGGQLVGAITLRYFPNGGLFKIGGLVDPECHKVGEVSNLSLPAKDPFVSISNYSELRIDLPARSYVLTLNGGADISLKFDPFVP